MHGVSPHLVRAVVLTESAFNPFAVSRVGAQGLMQLMPATATHMGVTDSLDPRQNVFGGTKYLSQLLTRFDGNVALALAGYNAGPAKVARYRGIPPYGETRGYVTKIRTIVGKNTGVFFPLPVKRVVRATHARAQVSGRRGAARLPASIAPASRARADRPPSHPAATIGDGGGRARAAHCRRPALALTSRRVLSRRGRGKDMRLTRNIRPETALVAGARLLGRRDAGDRADRLAPAAPVPGLAERDAGDVRARDRRLRLRPARRDDPDARRREAAHGHPRSEGRAAARRSS